jgi:hypothetical protein
MPCGATQRPRDPAPSHDVRITSAWLNGEPRLTRGFPSARSSASAIPIALVSAFGPLLGPQEASKSAEQAPQKWYRPEPAAAKSFASMRIEAVMWRPRSAPRRLGRQSTWQRIDASSHHCMIDTCGRPHSLSQSGRCRKAAAPTPSLPLRTRDSLSEYTYRLYKPPLISARGLIAAAAAAVSCSTNSCTICGVAARPIIT